MIILVFISYNSINYKLTLINKIKLYNNKKMNQKNKIKKRGIINIKKY